MAETGMQVQQEQGRKPNRPMRPSPKQPFSFWLGGVVLTALFALAGLFLAKLPGVDRVGPLACAILLAVLYRNLRGYPEMLRAGVQFSSKRLLRVAIVLFGLQLNVETVLHQGLGLLAMDALAVVFAITVMMLVAKRLRADLSLSLLLGVGTGVCGAAAIAAVSPILKAKEEDTALGVGMIALVGTVFALAYTVLRPFLPLDALTYAAWTGTSLHEIAHVALAGAPAGEDALALALLAKLGRVLLLVPLCFLLLFWVRRKQGSREDGATARIEVPWFLFGFLLMSLLGTYGLPQGSEWVVSLMEAVKQITVFLLAMAMVGLGVNVSLRDVRSKAMRPLAAMVVTSVLLSLLMYGVVGQFL